MLLLKENGLFCYEFKRYPGQVSVCFRFMRDCADFIQKYYKLLYRLFIININLEPFASIILKARLMKFCLVGGMYLGYIYNFIIVWSFTLFDICL